MTTPLNPAAAPLASLVEALSGLIAQGRQQALRAVDMVQVQTCWEVGRHIVDFEQGGEARAAYGKRLLPELAQALTSKFGRGFDTSNLRYMRLFYNAFPIRDALRHELSWTHYRLLLRVDSAQARQWYMTEAATQNWSSRALERQMGTLFYERLLLSEDKVSVTAEAVANLVALPPRAPYLHARPGDAGVNAHCGLIAAWKLKPPSPNSKPAPRPLASCCAARW